MLNNMTLIGRLGQDPTLNETGTGKKVTNFSVATTTYSGAQKHTDWFKVTAWEKTAEACAQYLKKGSLVYVDGPVTIEEYKTSNGDQRQNLAVTARNVKFLDPKNKNETDTDF